MAKDNARAGRGKKDTSRLLPHTKRLLSERALSDAQLQEFLSVVAQLFCSGAMTANEMKAQINSNYRLPFAEFFRGEKFWDLVRLAVAEGHMETVPRTGSELQGVLLDRFPWLTNRVTIVKTASQEVLATAAAEQVVTLIRAAASRDRARPVHVGFAGGRTLRLIAERLVSLLSQDHRDNPREIVFHAMVAGFDKDDFSLDPNSFINCFLDADSPISFELVRLPMPGIVTSGDEYAQLRALPSIARLLDSARDIEIVVTSGSLRTDQSSTIHAFIEHLSQEYPPEEFAQLMRLYEEEEVVGDFLWQPITRRGPLQLQSTTPFRMSTLIPLPELQSFIQQYPQRRVLLVLGRSGVSGMPKSELLSALLAIQPRLFTDLVVDTPTLHGYLNPEIVNQYMPPAPKQRR